MNNKGLYSYSVAYEDENEFFFHKNYIMPSLKISNKVLNLTKDEMYQILDWGNWD